MTLKIRLSLNSFDDKRFCENSVKGYPHNENLYLLKRDLIDKIVTAPVDLLIKLGLGFDKDIDKDNDR